MIPPTGPDPREEGVERDVRPMVPLPRGGLSGKALAGGAAVAGLLLFGVLDARRRSATAPTTALPRTEVAASSAPPPLYVPPEPVYVLPPTAMMPPLSPAPTVTTPAPTPPPVVSQAPNVAALVPGNPLPQSGGSYPGASPAPTRPPRVASGPALVADGSIATTLSGESLEAQGQQASEGKDGEPVLGTTRARAATFANRSTTVPQGTLIPAVLETAFDSTRPGFARALVQFDIRGFDGTRILIPRGSRLIGRYGTNNEAGQNRAMVTWTRLIRPDGVTIAIGSPAADTLGRGGVKAEVNSHFLERFGGAILQSALDTGIALAARSSNTALIYPIPGSLGGATSNAIRPREVKPTLKVPAGRSISVFVARDLDFSSAEGFR